MLKSRYFCGGSVLAVVLTFGVTQSAAAQAPKPPAAGAAAGSEVSEVIVTGSYIAGTPTNAALPVNVIGADDLKKQGSPTTVNLIKTITAAQGSIGESNRFLGTAAGAATVNLRGFGSARTLVLFNGQRMASSPAAVALESVDINFIPNIAIGRIEILRDGAAATYGSDAVGGVVNFITRHDLEGWEFNADYSYIKDSGGDYDISAARGWRFDRGDAMITATYRRRSELRTTDRDWALQSFAKNNFGGWSTASNPGVFQTGTAAQLATGTFSQSFVDNGCAELGGVLVSAAAPSSGCRFQFTQFDNLVNDEYHYSIYGQLNFQITDDINFHGEVLWARHDVPNERVSPAQSTTQFPTPIVASGGSPGGGTSPYPAVGLNQQSRFYVPNTNPGLIAFLANPANCPALGSICTNAAANGVVASQTLWRPEGYGGNPLFDDGADHQARRATAFRVSGSLTGHTFDDIGWRVSATYQVNHGEAGAGPDISVTRLQLALRGLGGPGCNPVTGTPGAGGCEYFNPFSNAYTASKGLGGTNPFAAPSASNNSSTLLNWLHLQLTGDTYTELAVGEAVFNGQVPFDIGGGPIGWAFGVQARYDRTQITVPDFYDINATPCVDSIPFGDGLPGCGNSGTGAFTFYSAVQEIDVDRTVSSVFGEVKLPITDKLELSAAARYEYYGGNFGSTTNPKVSIRWQALDWLAFRGSAGSTFRAPTQPSITPGNVRGLAQFNLPGVGSLYRPVDTANNPNLQPETADTYNVGAIVQTSRFHATLDYYKFKFKDELTNETAASLVSTMFPSATPSTWKCDVAAFRSRFTFADDGNPATDDCSPANLLAVKANLINGPSVDTSGLDFDGTYFWPEALFGGDLTFGADATYLIEYKRGALVTLDGFTIAPALDRAGKTELLSAFYSYPKWRANGYIQWTSGPHNLRWTTHFKSGTDNLVGTSSLKTDDEITHDLVYTGQLPWDTTLTVGIINILDTDPPFTRSQYNYDYTNAFFLGRVIQLGVRKKF
ncbi:TonB-dependent receptor domain-containing protein [Phenylobacterium sp.]|uniref:TonB-dependent receptor domain-containing protein n=1 Tax=Phenylobacterium sp. TaxID=1871053 RepID=UPI002F4056BC